MQQSITRLFVVLTCVALAIGCQQQVAEEQQEQPTADTEEPTPDPEQPTPDTEQPTPDTEQPTADTEEQFVAVIVEAACGECLFGLPGTGCDLAVRIDGKAYYVDGTGIDDHGDAHSDDGFCNAIRRARVTGSIENDRFVVTSFELLPDDEE